MTDTLSLTEAVHLILHEFQGTPKPNDTAGPRLHPRPGEWCDAYDHAVAIVKLLEAHPCPRCGTSPPRQGNTADWPGIKDPRPLPEVDIKADVD